MARWNTVLKSSILLVLTSCYIFSVLLVQKLNLFRQTAPTFSGYEKKRRMVFKNIAQGRNSTASSVAPGFSIRTLTNGNRVGFIEHKSNTFLSKMELNPWIHIELNTKNSEQVGETEIYAVRVFMAESECNSTLSMNKLKLRKCKTSRSTDISVPNMYIELLDSGNTEVASRAFSSPRSTYVWMLPNGSGSISVTDISSIRVSTRHPKGTQIRLGVAEIEVYIALPWTNRYTGLKNCEQNRAGDSCLDNILHTSRFLPLSRETNIVSGRESVRRAINKQQEVCKNRHLQAFLPGPNGKGAGFGSTIFWLTGSFSEAFKNGRTTVFSGSFNYAENKYCGSRGMFGRLECYFKPMSSCSGARRSVINIASKRNVLPKAYRDGPPKDKRFDILPRIKGVRNNIFLWRSEQLRWLTRLNNATEELLNLEKKKKLLKFRKGHMIGMHIRQGDGCKHGRRKQHGCRTLYQYILEARTLRDMYGEHVKKIFLATDSEEIIQQINSFEPEFTFVYLKDTKRAIYDSRTKIESRIQNNKIDSHRILLETLTDLFLLSECDYFVTHQASALSRLSLSFASIRLGFLPPYISMDGPWCYHWRMCCDVKANGEQKTC